MIRIKDKNIQKFETDHIDRARRMSPECTVLMKKDGNFPLSSAGKLAVYGNGVRKTIKGGTGSGDVNVRHFVNVEEGLLNAGFVITTTSWLNEYDIVINNARKNYVQGLKEAAKQAGVSAVMLGMGKIMQEPEYELPLDGEGDTAIYVLTRNSGEGGDRDPGAGDIALTETEKRDILTINEKYEKFMLVLNVGGMVDLACVKEVKNILLLGQLGTSTGDVLADLLLGKNYPSGKLTMTWTDLEAYPSTEGFGDVNDTYYNEGIYIGYRYFDSVSKEVTFPFGFGLSYTEFELSCKDLLVDEKEISVVVNVRNAGNRAGKEIVQVYYSAPSGKIDRPYQDLAGFGKTKELLPGEDCDIRIKFQTIDMAAYETESSSYLLEKGDYVVRVGNNSRSTHICGIVRVTTDVTTKKLKNICIGDVIEEKKPVFLPYTYKGEQEEKENASVFKLDSSKIVTEEAIYSGIPEELNRVDSICWDDVKSGSKSVEKFAAGLTNEELANICLGAYTDKVDLGSIIGSAAFSIAGAAGETTNRLDEKYHLDTLVMADGPAGIRVSPTYKIVNGKVKSTVSSFGHDMLDLMEESELQMMQQTSTQSEKEVETEFYQYCVSIPIGTDLAQSFNLDVIKEFGDIVGNEMEIFGIHLWLAPAMNIFRSPLCGRNFEYYSEDPLVSGLVAAAMTEGVQKHKGCGTTIKHFACNNQETNRYTSNSILSERALREIYLRGFEICVKKAQPHALMTSYNLINGEHACNSKDILTNVLRDEWGYKGIVMTDWFVTTAMLKKSDTKHPVASAAGCVKAGNDITMPGGATDMEDIQRALVDENHLYHLVRAELQACAVRVLKKIYELKVLV